MSIRTAVCSGLCATFLALAVVAPASAAERLAFAPVGVVQDVNAEIVTATPDGRTLLSTNPNDDGVDVTDITDPARPRVRYSIPTGGYATSVAVTPSGAYALIAAQTGGDHVIVFDLGTREIVRRIRVPLGPDSIAISPSGRYAAVAIENEGEGQGSIAILDLRRADPDYWVVHDVALDPADPAFLNPEDLQPEYVDFGPDDTLAATLQENNAIVIVDPARAVADQPAVLDAFSAGFYDGLTDTAKGGLIEFSEPLVSPREPDSISWTPDGGHLVTANEGEEAPSGRGLSIYTPQGELVSETIVERDAADRGWYNQDRASSRSVELEGGAVGTLGGREVAILASERSGFIAVYDIIDRAHPSPIAFLPSGERPEDVVILSDRRLVAVANEDGGPGLSIYRQFQEADVDPDAPAIVGQDIPWGEVTGIGAGSASSLYVVPQNGGRPAGQALDPEASRPWVPQILEVQPSGGEARIVERTMITVPAGHVPSWRLADVAADPRGGWWVVREDAAELVHISATGRVNRTIPVDAGGELTGVAVTRDGATAWVSSETAVATVTLADGAVAVHPYPPAGDAGLQDLATAPDGGLAGLETVGGFDPAAPGRLLRLDASGAAGAPVTVLADVEQVAPPLLVPRRGLSGLAIASDGSAWTTHLSFGENPSDTNLHRHGAPFADPAPPVGGSPTELPPTLPAGIRVPQASSVIRAGSRLFVGGNFAYVDQRAVRGLVRADATTGVPEAAPSVNPGGQVSVVVQDGYGGYYVGGSFTEIGGVARRNLARVRADGSVMAGFNAQIAGGQVHALLVVGRRLHVAGENLGSVGGQPRRALAAVDIMNGSVKQFAPEFTRASDANGRVFALAAGPAGTILAGGDFAKVGASTRPGLVRLHQDGKVAGAFNAKLDARADVRLLAVSGANVYAGGDLASVDGTARSGVALVNATTGALVPAFDAGPTNGSLRGMALGDGALYLMGSRIAPDGSERELSAVDAATGAYLPSFVGLSGRSLTGVAAIDGDVYVTGYFMEAPVPSQERQSIAKLDGESGRIDPAFQLTTSSGTLGVADAGGGDVFAFGSFTEAGIGRAGMAAYDAETAELDMDWQPRRFVGGLLDATASRLYAADGFTDAVVALDITDGSVDGGFTPRVEGGSVIAARVVGDRLVVGGDFAAVDDVIRTDLAAIDLRTGRLDRSFEADTDGTVRRIADGPNGSLAVAGSFTRIRDHESRRVALIDPETGMPDVAFSARVGGAAYDRDVYVNDVADTPGGLVVAGPFAAVDGVARASLARLDRTTGVLDGWNPAPEGGSAATAVAVGDHVVIGGDFTRIAGVDRGYVAALTAGGALVGSWAPPIDGPVFVARTVGPDLALGGQFSAAGAAGLALLRGPTAG